MLRAFKLQQFSIWTGTVLHLNCNCSPSFDAVLWASARTSRRLCYCCCFGGPPITLYHRYSFRHLPGPPVIFHHCYCIRPLPGPPITFHHCYSVASSRITNRTLLLLLYCIFKDRQQNLTNAIVLHLQGPQTEPYHCYSIASSRTTNRTLPLLLDIFKDHK